MELTTPRLRYDRIHDAWVSSHGANMWACADNLDMILGPVSRDATIRITATSRPRRGTMRFEWEDRELFCTHVAHEGFVSLMPRCREYAQKMLGDKKRVLYARVDVL